MTRKDELTWSPMLTSVCWTQQLLQRQSIGGVLSLNDGPAVFIVSSSIAESHSADIR